MDLSKIEAYEADLKLIPGTIIDGVIDGEQYFSSEFKIAWFLKEPYSNEGEGFHMKEHYGQPDAYEEFFRNTATPTWHPIIYCSYGILNGFQKWDQMQYIRNKPEMCDVIKNIAIINANKSASLTGTRTEWGNLNEGFNKYKKHIEKQIEVLQPDIHIFGNTFYLYKDYFGLTDEHKILPKSEIRRCEVYSKDSKLFIDVYHPAQMSLDRDIYVDQIINAAKNWAMNINVFQS